MTWYPRVSGIRHIKFYDCPKTEMIEWIKAYWNNPYSYRKPPKTLDDYQSANTNNIFLPWDDGMYDRGAECLEPGMVAFYGRSGLQVMKEKDFLEMYEER